ncbi:uncharacterized protein LOC121371771 [Gigantopelta aegis]|uniref:uncharacterized protein LOC121371771 n=1 Tax=Gigantopelta aegis TaxID=1735272 RepID=UPI001B88AF71|nr:uncharacterized protein LOC121371771 [Gigantopelta aegis]
MPVRKLGAVQISTAFLDGWIRQQRQFERRLYQYRDDIQDVASEPIKQFLKDDLMQKANVHSRNKYDCSPRTFFEGRSLVRQDFVEASDIEVNRQMQMRCNKAALPPLPSRQCYPKDDCDKCELKLMLNHIQNILRQPVALCWSRYESKHPDHDVDCVRDHCLPLLLSMTDNPIAPTTTPPPSPLPDTTKHDVGGQSTKKKRHDWKPIIITTGGAHVLENSQVIRRARYMHSPMRRVGHPHPFYTQLSHGITELMAAHTLVGHSLKPLPRTDGTSGKSTAREKP